MVRAIGDAARSHCGGQAADAAPVRFAAALTLQSRSQTLRRDSSRWLRRSPSSAPSGSRPRCGRCSPALLGRTAVELLRETGLLAQILPEVAATESLQERLQLLEALDRPSFPQALAVLLGWPDGAELISTVAARWRLSNKESDRTAWLLAHGKAFDGAAQQPWSRLQPVLVHDGASELVALYQSAARLGATAQADIDFCRQKLALPARTAQPAAAGDWRRSAGDGRAQGKALLRALDGRAAGAARRHRTKPRRRRTTSSGDNGANRLSDAARPWTAHRTRPTIFVDRPAGDVYSIPTATISRAICQSTIWRLVFVCCTSWRRLLPSAV